jgi:hypothetical protein
MCVSIRTAPMRKSFHERLSSETILFDGGMGTMLYAKGIPLRGG